MPLHPLAGQPVPASRLDRIPRLMRAYYSDLPDVDEPAQRVQFGTSGHRGTSLARTFNEAHILATTQAICEYRAAEGIDGPLFLGMDTHALSEAAHATALEVLAANGVPTRIAPDGAYAPTPAVSFAILRHNRRPGSGKADGIIITPSHNPPGDGGFKYNPPTGGPAGSSVTRTIQDRANELLAGGNKGVRRQPLARALTGGAVSTFDYRDAYVSALGDVLQMDRIRESGLKLGVDPLGGAGVDYWEPIADRFGLDLTVVNPTVDPAFAFMRLDHDGKIRMDCSSKYAMAGLIELADGFDLAFGNDPDADRHGIVTPTGGLMNPNHYLAVAIQYLFRNRPGWPAGAAVGKTLVSSSMIDRVAGDLGVAVREVPVGFKWFVDGLLDGSLGFGGEESAGASFLDVKGRPWSTDKDGLLLNLLAAELTAVTGRTPDQHYADLEQRFGTPVYQRVDAPATREQKAVLSQLAADDVTATTLAGEPIRDKLTHAPGNGAAIGGLKVVTESGWFAARPSGTEAIYKIYAESFRGADHLALLQEEAKALVDSVMGG